MSLSLSLSLSLCDGTLGLRAPTPDHNTWLARTMSGLLERKSSQATVPPWWGLFDFLFTNSLTVSWLAKCRSGSLRRRFGTRDPCFKAVPQPPEDASRRCPQVEERLLKRGSRGAEATGRRDPERERQMC